MQQQRKRLGQTRKSVVQLNHVLAILICITLSSCAKRRCEGHRESLLQGWHGEA